MAYNVVVSDRVPLESADELDYQNYAQVPMYQPIQSGYPCSAPYAVVPATTSGNNLQPAVISTPMPMVTSGGTVLVVRQRRSSSCRVCLIIIAVKVALAVVGGIILAIVLGISSANRSSYYDDGY
ncbi:uncharacterized protein LOC144444794 [Glandiceps talaboti]